MASFNTTVTEMIKMSWQKEQYANNTNLKKIKFLDQCWLFANFLT